MISKKKRVLCFFVVCVYRPEIWAISLIAGDVRSDEEREQEREGDLIITCTADFLSFCKYLVQN